MAMPAFGGGGAAQFQSMAEAAQAQNIEAVTHMINSGYNVNAQDQDGNTALHWAAWFKLESVARSLLERHARPDIGNVSGESSVHWAAKSSNVQMLNMLFGIDRGLLSQRDCDGFTPFIISAQNDNASIMEWMYTKGISVEEQDDWGRTALQWACYKGHRKTVQWLLSRWASVAHRDHEGMTAIHWAALKGHDQVADMLLDVGAVQLLHVPDAAGDTPIALAMRKKNRYLVMSFHKAQLFQALIGRPHIAHNHFASLFLVFNIFNIIVFALFLAPRLAKDHTSAVIAWSCLMAATLILWAQNCLSDPGWVQPRTIWPQHRLIGEDPTSAFDAEQPVESQMVHYDTLNEEIIDDPDSSELARLEVEQNKFNYQRQLITEARKRMHEGGAYGAGGPGFLSAGTGGTELQPLMNPADAQNLGISNFAMTMQGQEVQLERALQTLEKRERATGDAIGRVRTETLLRLGSDEYLSLLDKGDFKQVCVVCRARREMRSHHCKECGRCVSRLDHHCPWIDNCVGLGNQRSFYCFIILLFCTILFFYYVVGLYCADVVFPEMSDGLFHGLLHGHASWRPCIVPLLVCVASAFDLIWVAFVGALVARHTAYMLVNVTTYEVLVRPAHVQRRFPKNRGRFWFLADFGVLDCIQNCVNYWTLSDAKDEAAFSGSGNDTSSAGAAGQDNAKQFASGQDDYQGPSHPSFNQKQVAPQSSYGQQAQYQPVPLQYQHGLGGAGQRPGGW